MRSGDPGSVMIEELQNLCDLRYKMVRCCRCPQDQRVLDLRDFFGISGLGGELRQGNTAEQMADPEFWKRSAD